MIHTIGNLTLLTKALNPSVSNGAWDLKRKEIAKHSAIAMNRRFYDIDDWNELRIFERSKELLNLALQAWQRPESDATGSDAIETAHIMSLDFDKFIEAFGPIALDRALDTLPIKGPSEARSSVRSDGVSNKRKRELINVRIQDVHFEARSIPDLYRDVLEYLYQRGNLEQLRLPIASGSKRYILAKVPKHQEGNPFLVDVECNGYHMEAHNSRRQALAVLDNLLAMCGLEFEELREDPERVIVESGMDKV